MSGSVSIGDLKKVSTNRGKSLYDLSLDHPVLLVFLRYFGCSFCREALDDLGKVRSRLKERTVELICVHMDDLERAERYFKKYDIEGIQHVSDPEQQHYHNFGLVKGSFQQLFGLQNMMRGFDAAILQGQGIAIPKPLGDGFQMPGVFLIDEGTIQSSYIHRKASDRPDYISMIDRYSLVDR